MADEDEERVRELVTLLSSIVEGEAVHIALSALLSLASRIVRWDGRDVEVVAAQFVEGTHRAAMSEPMAVSVVGES